MTVLPVTIETLRELRLTAGEFDTLESLTHRGEGDIENPDRDALDMLVLSGLIRRLSVMDPDTGERVRWTNQWALTPEGAATVSMIDMIFDWDAFAFPADEINNLLDMRASGDLMDRPGDA